MDLGCYVLNAARQVGRWLDEAPSLISAEAILKEPNIDAAMRVELAYPSGIQAQLHWDMNAQDRAMVWTIEGTAGTATVPAFAVPHMDNRIVFTKVGHAEEQTLGDQTSYTYQLAALTSTLQTGAEFLIDVDDSVANAELIDDVYRSAGLAPRTSAGRLESKERIMTIGIAVIGAGMAGRAHAAGYRIAPMLYKSTLPNLRFVSIGDVSPELGSLAARRFRHERSPTPPGRRSQRTQTSMSSAWSWPTTLHREMVEGLVAAGKHVLCEKPLSDNLDDARAMADVARSADQWSASASPSAERQALLPSASLSPQARSVSFCTSMAGTGATMRAIRRARSAGGMRRHFRLGCLWAAPDCSDWLDWPLSFFWADWLASPF